MGARIKTKSAVELLRLVADLIEELGIEVTTCAAAGDDTDVVVRLHVSNSGVELVHAVNQPHALRVRQPRLPSKPDDEQALEL